ncbi:MAG: filamentous hemagglutinin N-terminal domain-containing protein [Rhabdochlamydiaceae bacterium]|nr:filamentous hemagglutinin N-terminal domain-containing protein [Rhabdochlamydiaceae bacterium]
MENFIIRSRLPVVLLLLTAPFCLSALPGQPEVVKGQCSYEVSGKSEVVKVSDKTILEYSKFNIGKQESVKYEQPSSRSTLLCRVNGKNVSKIRGQLEANGKLLLINPNGIIFTETAQVNIGTLIASTLDLQNDDFMTNSYKFYNDSSKGVKSIINQGKIQADQSVALIAPHIVNQGTIIAKTGTIALVGGEALTLSFEPDGKIQFAIDIPITNGSIEQIGNLKATEVYMHLPMAQKAIRSVLNDTGVIEAGHIDIKDGVISLKAGSSAETQLLSIKGDTVHMEEDLKIPGALDMQASTVIQHKKVIAKGPVHYKADQIFLGDDITTTGDILLDGSTTLFKSDSISLNANKYNKGKVLLTSTLDADTPSRSLKINNGKSPTEIKGAIGQKGPLRELVIDSGKMILHDNIGGINPGITGQLAIKSVEVEFKGSKIYTGEQFWNVAPIHLTHEGGVEIKTAGRPLYFGQDARLELDSTTALTIATQGGKLDLPPIISDRLQSITILSGQGQIYLKEIGKQVTRLHVEGKDLFLYGHLEAEEIFMEADHHLQYDASQGKEVISTAIQSRGNITLNSKRSMVGSSEKPLNINTKGELFVGAKTVAYLEGLCADQNPHAYPANPPTRTFFNGYEFNHAFMEDLLAEDEALLKTLTPALGQKIPTAFIDGAAIKPRKAPIYYDTSAH